MTKNQVKLAEIKDRLSLARSYYQAALSWQNKNHRRRMVVDLAYNAAELAVKGLILLKSDMMPSRHSGVVQRFSELYVKTGIIEKETGKNLHRCLDLRNQARYVPQTKITTEDVRTVMELAQKIINFLNNQIKII